MEKTASQIERAVSELRDAPFTASLLERMSEAGMASSSSVDEASGVDGTRARYRFRKMVILGLGSPTNSVVSRMQLALAIILRDHLGLRPEDVELYDPVFTPVDAQTLETRLLATVLSREVADAYCGPSAVRTTTATFFYMPHCEMALYEHLARANWGAFGAHAVVGNAFETYEVRWAGRETARECPRHVLAAATAIASEGGVNLPVDPDGSFKAAAAMGAFNDTSVQAFGDDVPEVEALAPRDAKGC